MLLGSYTLLYKEKKFFLQFSARFELFEPFELHSQAQKLPPVKNKSQIVAICSIPHLT